MRRQSVLPTKQKDGLTNPTSIKSDMWPLNPKSENLTASAKYLYKVNTKVLQNFFC